MHPHKETVHKFYEAVWNEADKEVIPELLSEDFAFRGSLGHVEHGHAGFCNYLDQVHQALGEYCCKVVDVVAEDNRAYARILYTGIHRGELFGFAPTHAKIKWDGVAIFTFTDGKIAELWALWDVNGVMKQLARFVD